MEQLLKSFGFKKTTTCNIFVRKGTKVEVFFGTAKVIASGRLTKLDSREALEKKLTEMFGTVAVNA